MSVYVLAQLTITDPQRYGRDVAWHRQGDRLRRPEPCGARSADRGHGLQSTAGRDRLDGR